MSTITTLRGKDGWSETVVKRSDKLLGIVVHPCTGARWFVHHAESSGPRGIPYPTRKAALAAILRVNEECGR